MTSPVLVVEGLRRSFGTLTAVDGVSLHIDQGETVGLLGPNGAGKTTAISMIAGLLRPDAGQVRINGSDMVSDHIATKRHLGLVPQDLAIYPELSARSNLLFFGRLQGMRGAALRHRVAEVLETVGLTDRATGPAKTFSGGMKRRLNIGIGLLHEPSLLILDEPTVGVDPQSRNAILEAVEALSTQGRAVLYTTHYMEEAERLCDRIGIIDAGRIIAEGTREDLVELTGRADTVTLVGDGASAETEAALTRIPVVRQVHRVEGEGRLVLSVEGAAQAISAIVTTVSASGMSLRDVEIARPDLESVFLHLTGKALRD
ncbi:MAG: export ABC transporter ATP-binding protein [Arsenicicoccus sp.]|nr:MAG: export ABC transporter ATP-binding protein [Arsenicicoccus sp.]